MGCIGAWCSGYLWPAVGHCWFGESEFFHDRAHAKNLIDKLKQKNPADRSKRDEELIQRFEQYEQQFEAVMSNANPGDLKMNREAVANKRNTINELKQINTLNSDCIVRNTTDDITIYSTCNHSLKNLPKNLNYIFSKT